MTSPPYALDPAINHLADTDRISLINKLTQRLELARPDFDKYDDYFSNRQALAYLAPEVAAATSKRLQSVSVNWPRLVIGSVEERLDVEGFRLAGNESADDSLWSIWQANALDEMSQLAHQDALIHRLASRTLRR